MNTLAQASTAAEIVSFSRSASTGNETSCFPPIWFYALHQNERLELAIPWVSSMLPKLENSFSAETKGLCPQASEITADQGQVTTSAIHAMQHEGSTHP